MKYLSLIQAIALLHQHQRQLVPVVTQRHEVNDWIRKLSGVAGVVDFESAVRDGADADHYLPGFGADGIHPTEAAQPAVLKNIEMLGLDYLIAIGGDDTLSYASELDRKGMKVIAEEQARWKRAASGG